MFSRVDAGEFPNWELESLDLAAGPLKPGGLRGDVHLSNSVIPTGADHREAMICGVETRTSPGRLYPAVELPHSSIFMRKASSLGFSVSKPWGRR